MKIQKGSLYLGGGRQVSKPGQRFGTEAMEALKGKIINKRIRLDIVDIDRYRRMVSIVWLGNRNINLEMVREGFAEAYREYLKPPYREDFLKAEATARAERRGIWGISGHEKPGDFRARMRLRGF